MAGHVLELRGCTPEPLGNYLKGLGVFRLVAEQADPQARAWWKAGVLNILQGKWCDKGTANGQVVEWLLTECRFTPLVAPWQKGTGYLPLGKRAAGGIALKELLGSTNPGAEQYREVFRSFADALGVNLCGEAREWPEQMKAITSDIPDAHLLRMMRNRMRSPVGLKWLDAVGVAASRSKDGDNPTWFPILASGGGEASGQYIVNHQQRLKTVLLEGGDQIRGQLQSSLFGHNHVGALEAKAMGAMYYPSLMKAPNVGQDFLPDPERRVNPWDFVLLLEGSLVWSLAATKRNGVTKERASFPFYCRSSFGGSATSGPKEVEGAERSIANGELWCPLWSAPSTLMEIERIFGEGRIQVGGRPASRSLDFALAMSGLGLDRGIQVFYRYSLLERSGSGRQTTLLAVPNGTFTPNVNARLQSLVELRPFAESIATNLCDNSQQPRRFMNARIDFERAWFAATTSLTDQPSREVYVLVAAGRLMRELGNDARRPGIVKLKIRENTAERQIPPIATLSQTWSDLLSHVDQDAAFRLARAVAAITAWGTASTDGRQRPAVEAVRTNLLPLARRGKDWVWDDTARSAVWSRASPLPVNLVAVLRRRLVDAQRGDGEGLPLWSPHGATFTDLLTLWQGAVDEERLADLIHALALIGAGRWAEGAVDNWQIRHEPTPDLRPSAVWFDSEDQPHTDLPSPRWQGRPLLSAEELRAAADLPRVYPLLKLCFLGGRLPRRPVERQTVGRDGSEPHPPACLDILTLLEVGRLPEAAQTAARRLRAKGYPSILIDPRLQALREQANDSRPVKSDAAECHLDLQQCRRLAGLMLIPVQHPGVLAALAIKPETMPS
jgi:CRISPR-associated protein Csx17